MIRSLLSLLLLLPMLLSCVTQERVQRVELIAHAGGEIDGYVYTNSLEALQQAASRGYKFIELDLLLASDSVLSSADFARQRIHGRYTPLTAPMIEEFFLENEGLYLVTDKISSPVLLSKAFPRLKERMVVEAFSYPHYEQLCDEGYYRVLYSCMAPDLSLALVKNLLFDRLFPGKRIEWLALHTSGLYYPSYKFINKVRRFKVALFTLDNYNDVTPEQLQRAGMIYTNTIVPE